MTDTTRSHFDESGNWVVPAYPAHARVLADFTGACPHENGEVTHQSLARDLHLERAQLINLLVEARGHIAYLVGGIGFAGDVIYPHMRERAAEAKAFLDRGLFGDKANNRIVDHDDEPEDHRDRAIDSQGWSL